MTLKFFLEGDFKVRYVKKSIYTLLHKIVYDNVG